VPRVGRGEITSPSRLEGVFFHLLPTRRATSRAGASLLFGRGALQGLWTRVWCKSAVYLILPVGPVTTDVSAGHKNSLPLRSQAVRSNSSTRHGMGARHHLPHDSTRGSDRAVVARKRRPPARPAAAGNSHGESPMGIVVRLRTELVLAALQMAVWRTKPAPGLIVIPTPASGTRPSPSRRGSKRRASRRR
jgi:hypothetical protein